jgi:hypothetical protein
MRPGSGQGDRLEEVTGLQGLVLRAQEPAHRGASAVLTLLLPKSSSMLVLEPLHGWAVAYDRHSGDEPVIGAGFA